MTLTPCVAYGGPQHWCKMILTKTIIPPLLCWPRIINQQSFRTNARALKCWFQLAYQNNKFCFGFYVLFAQIYIQTLAQWCQWTVFFWNFHIFNITWQSITFDFGDIWSARLLRIFALVAFGNLQPFLPQMPQITQCYLVYMPQIGLILPLPVILLKSSLSGHQTPLFPQ